MKRPPAWRRTALVLLAAALLCACDPPPDEAGPAAAVAVETDLAGLALREDERLYTLRPEQSTLLVYTWRGGKLARFGHNHVLSAKRVSGSIAFRPGITGSRFSLLVPLPSLDVDDPALRAAAGEAFDSKPSAEDIAATRANMLGESALDAKRHPLATIAGEVRSVTGDEARVRMEISVRGAVHTKEVLLRFEHSAAALRVHGRTTLKQSDFGITPFSVMLGALTVRDEVNVNFDLRAGSRTGS